jgi:amino acid transporter
MWYKMGETGALPKWFARVHPVYRTPVNAIIANMVLSLAVGLVVGLLLNPSRSYFLVDGLILVLAVLYIYVSANVAVALYYLKQRRSEFNWILHIALPVISTGALIYVTIKSFQPFPSFPYNYAPLIDAIWFAIGLGILGVLWYRKKDDWIARAGEATVDADEIKEIDPA